MVSTNCRGCNVYLKIEKGQAIPPPQFEDNPRYQSSISNTETQASDSPESNPPLPLPQSQPAPNQEPKAQKSLSPLPPTPESTSQKAPKSKTPTPPVPKETPRDEAPPAAAIPQTQPRNPLPKKPSKPKAPPPPPKPEPLQELQEQNAPAKKHTAKVEPPQAEQKELIPSKTTERYHPQVPVHNEHAKPRIAPLIDREKKRDVKCFECGESHAILADSKSALCPHCGAYIGLSDYDIKNQHNSRIQTRGNVFVHKKGHITGITIHAHNLTIEGEIQGGAECTGDFIVRKTGKINGAVTSDRVIIERRAKVDFLSTVEAREVIIDGHVTGSVACKKLTLKKRATLDGDLTVASLSVEEGAKHTGNIKMTGLL